MEEKNYLELEQGWEKLYIDLKTNKKTDIELFKEVFTQTYNVLSPFAQAECIDKKLISVIMNAYSFAKMDKKDMEFKYYAAMVLTERLLNCYIAGNQASCQDGTYLYIIEARREIYIDFKNIHDSLVKLIKLFEEDHWGNW